MKSFGASAAAATLSLALCPSLAVSGQSGQTVSGESCGGPVFKSGEVTRKARLTKKPEPGFTAEARAQDARGVVRLHAVLCRTGRVTDIEIVQGLPHGLTEQAVAAARRIRFQPARKDGRKVSQTVTLEYGFNVFDGDSVSLEESAKHAGRIVEELIIAGNRRLTDQQLIAHLRTRPGDPYDETTLRRDLQALLELGTLDKTQTRVSTEQGRRGGVVVIFNVLERPVIRTIAFRGLKSIGEAEVLAALAGRQPGLRREGVYDPAHVEEARRFLLELLAARGHKRATVEVLVEEVSAVSVGLAFVVKEGPPARRDDVPGRWF